MKIDNKKLEIVMATRCISLKELSKRSSISEVTLTRLKRNVQKPKPKTIGKIAKALKCNVIEIIETEN